MPEFEPEANVGGPHFRQPSFLGRREVYQTPRSSKKERRKVPLTECTRTLVDEPHSRRLVASILLGTLAFLHFVAQ